MRTFLFLATITLAASAHAKEWPCNKFAGFPALLDGCEGERCEVYGNKLEKDVALYSDPDLHSKVVARLKKGQRVQSIEQKTLVLQMGKFTVGRDADVPESYWAIQDLKKYGVQLGDTIFGVQYGGEGVYQHCLGDRLFYLDNAYGLEMGKGERERLRTEAWAFVKSKNGSGWAPGTDWYRSVGD